MCLHLHPFLTLSHPLVTPSEAVTLYLPTFSLSLEAAPHLPADECKTKTRPPSSTSLPPRVNTELQQVRSLNEHTFSPHTIAVRESRLCVAATIEKMPTLPLLFSRENGTKVHLRNCASFRWKRAYEIQWREDLFTGFKFAVVSLIRT